MAKRVQRLARVDCMSAHKKNWFRRLFGDVPSQQTPSNQRTDSEDVREEQLRNTSDGQKQEPDLHGEDARNADDHGTGERGADDHSADESDLKNSVGANANVTQNGAAPSDGTDTVFDPADLRDADFYRRMRVTLQPIETAQASVDIEDFSPDSPIRPFTKDSVVRLALDIPGNALKKTGQSVITRPQELSHPSKASRSRRLRTQIKDGHTSFPLSPENLDDRGPVEDLYRMGYRNLWQDLIDSDLEVKEVSPAENKKVWTFEGSSPYIGSAPIFLEELMQKYLPEVDTAPGLLFTMPSSTQMLVREVTSGKELLQTMGLLAGASAEEYFYSPDKLSPRLHLWHEGQIETISDMKPPEQNNTTVTEIQIKPTAYLMSLIGDDPETPEGWQQ